MRDSTSSAPQKAPYASAAAVDITLAVEAEYGCSIPAPEIAEHLQSVRTLAGYVAANLS
nr:acyl carrier protein [Achromobacter xylosoxidans]